MNNQYYILFNDTLINQYGVQNGVSISKTPLEALNKYLYDNDYIMQSYNKVSSTDTYNVCVRGKRNNYYYIKLVKSTLVTVYHGSPHGIRGNIRPISSKYSDFGKGFYVATLEDYALSNVVSEGKDKGYLYTLAIDISKYNVYKFDNSYLWLFYTAYNRGHLNNIREYKNLYEQIAYINSFNVLYGLVADDRSAYAIREFFNDNITDLCLIECLTNFNLGYQYTFKTVESCRDIQIIKKELIKGERYKKAIHEKSIRIGTSETIVNEIKKKYLRTGKFFSEILGEYYENGI